jgi:hypothetical protein
LLAIDCSLLNDVKPEERHNIEEEKAFFAQNPDKGAFLNWITVGSLINPAKISGDLLKSLAAKLPDWELDHLVERLHSLHGWLETESGPANRSVVYYIHCEAGEDRTGEVSGAYYMGYLHWSMQQALDYDNHIETRHISFMSRNAMNWYCYYLKYGKGIDIDCEYTE